MPDRQIIAVVEWYAAIAVKFIPALALIHAAKATIAAVKAVRRVEIRCRLFISLPCQDSLKLMSHNSHRAGAFA